MQTNSDATDVPSDFEDLSEPIKLPEPPREEKIPEKIDVPIKPISQGTLSYTEIYQARLIFLLPVFEFTKDNTAILFKAFTRKLKIL